MYSVGLLYAKQEIVNSASASRLTMSIGFVIAQDSPDAIKQCTAATKLPLGNELIDQQATRVTLPWLLRNYLRWKFN